VSKGINEKVRGTKVTGVMKQARGKVSEVGNVRDEFNGVVGGSVEAIGDLEGRIRPESRFSLRKASSSFCSETVSDSLIFT
jgi:hypothetical protein